MPWFDIGINFSDKEAELANILARAAAKDVHKLMLTGTSLEVSRQSLCLAEQHPQNLYATAGIHPHNAKDAEPDFIEQLTELAQHPQVLAIGECGLDFNRNFSPKDTQLQVFEAQLDLACKLKVPIFLHERDAFNEQMALLKKYASGLSGGVLHCFTGTTEQMHAYLDLGLYIGVTGWLCDEKRGTELRKAVKNLPLERILLETDSPYLWPKTLARKLRKDLKYNEPCNLPHIAQQLALLMNEELEHVKAHSWQNTLDLFAIKPQEVSHVN